MYWHKVKNDAKMMPTKATVIVLIVKKKDSWTQILINAGLELIPPQ